MLNNLFKCTGSIIKVLFIKILIEQVQEQRNLFEAKSVWKNTSEEKASEDLENKKNQDNTHAYKANTLCKTLKTNINNLENSFNCFYLRIPKCLGKQSLFCFVLYCECL